MKTYNQNLYQTAQSSIKTDTCNGLNQEFATNYTKNLQLNALKVYKQRHWGLVTNCTEALQLTTLRVCNQLH